jgi:hypothetical protein
MGANVSFPLIQCRCLATVAEPVPEALYALEPSHDYPRYDLYRDQNKPFSGLPAASAGATSC